LAAQLTGWDIDILTPAEYNKGLDDLEKVLKSIEGVDDVLVEKINALGIISLADVEEVGTEPLVVELELGEELAQQIVQRSAEGRVAVEQAAKEAAAQAAAAEAAAAEQAASSAEDPPAATAPAEGLSPQSIEDGPAPVGAAGEDQAASEGLLPTGGLAPEEGA
jgi:hypothetical protein